MKRVSIVDSGKFLFSAILMLLLCLVVFFYGCSDDEGNFFGTGGKMPRKEYRIVGDSGIYRVEVREPLENWQLLGEGLKSRKSCNEIIDQDFSNGG